MPSDMPENQDDRMPQPKPSETGMHGTVPVEQEGEPVDERKFPLARITKITAITALAAAVAATAARQINLKSDPDARESAGNGDGEEDLCGRNSFASDAKPEEIAKPGEDECQFVTDPDGTMHIIGHTLIDKDGKPRDCFLQPVFSPDAAMKVRGEISGSMEEPGRIFLDKGKLCVMMLHENDPEKAESLVIGQASLHITTTGKVLVKMLDAESYKDSGEVLRYVMVAPVKGEVLIVQDGRSGQIHLREGDKPVKIPIDKLEQTGGCYIARPGNNGDGECDGDGGGSGNGSSGGEFILTASALLMVLRRRRI